MKKFVTALVALTAALFLMTGSFAEESHEVNAQITFTTDETVDSIAAPEIPIGSLSAEVFGFDAGQTYAVYSAPDVKSLRGAGGKSKVSTNDWVQVFGREGDWLLVQYDVEDKYYRIGYITAKAIPTGMTVPELNLGNETAVTMDKVNVTDDPLGNQNTLTELPADSHVTKLGVMGDAGDAGNADHLKITENGNIFGQLSTDAAEWSGQWSICKFDASRMNYWNEPEFELTIYRDEGIRTYGLRICWEPYGVNGASYALILSESERTSGLVLCK